MKVSKWWCPKLVFDRFRVVNEIGHFMENCFPLKAKVQSLVKVEWLKFKKIGEEPDVNQNPLPNHVSPYLSPRFNNDEGEKFGCANEKQCLYHLEIDDHFIEDCREFKNEVKKLMDAKILLVGQMNMQEIEVDMIIDASNDTSITIISENTISPHPLVYQCPPEFELNNWEIKKTLKVSNGSQKICNKDTKVEGNIDDVVDFEVSICNLKQNIEG
ncbi:uncharacterized protein E5676_scaffold409G002000 [Cucumis melo var. makuwa]|uniref:Uncharacterized protein n=1 Tax=Cucumis melo var. makuwa TaxID=1194695 RepID=A0A5D3BYH0_CUCMM|nr:uncharacterized protein E6C27_scaffold60G004750 [Cucumis melo var. makuwa]TYK04567.1 uncharacterized protein E5676_scaffold409G002000 [Cucumis melo var. makuwa]